MTSSSTASPPSNEEVDGQQHHHHQPAITSPCTTSYIATNSTPPTPITQHISSGSNIALGLIGGTFVSILALTAPFILAQLRSPLPYMATPRHKIEKALTFITIRRRQSYNGIITPDKNAPRQQKSVVSTSHVGNTTIHDKNRTIPLHQQHRPNFVDLGSGDGTAVLTAAALGYNAIGFELNPTLWLISSLRRILSTNRTIRSQSRFILGDMFHNEIAKTSLRDADCVMIFGVNSLMPQIARLVQRECCRPGCLLMSYRFRVPLHSSSSIEKDDAATNAQRADGVEANLIYDEEEMRIYELNTRR
jgi:hypothetical protein